jgi:hypothetical protein
MKKKEKPPTALERMAHARRTSVVIPEDLWLKAKHIAATRHQDLRTLIVEGLNMVLMLAKGDATFNVKPGVKEWSGGPGVKTVFKKQKKEAK